MCTGSHYCEPLYVTLPPTVNWGQTFLLAPFNGQTGNQHYKLVTSSDATVIAYRCGTQDSEGSTIATAGEDLILSFTANSYCYLTASSPIFVVQMMVPMVKEILPLLLYHQHLGM